MNQDDHQPKPVTLNTCLTVLYWIAQIWAMPLEMWLRSRFGQRYIDLWFLGGLCWASLFSQLRDPNGDAVRVQAFCWVTVGLALIHRMQAVARDRRGQTEHSQYDGLSHLSRLGLSEEFAKELLEPMLGFVIGMFTLLWHLGLGQYLVGAAIAIFVKRGMITDIWRKREIAMNDAIAEQQYLAESIRRRR